MEFIKNISVPPSSLEPSAQETQQPTNTTNIKEVSNLATDVIEQSSTCSFSEVVNAGQEFNVSTLAGGDASQIIDDPPIVGGAFDSSGVMRPTDDLDAIATNQRADTFNELMYEIKNLINGLPEPDKGAAQAAFNNLMQKIQPLIDAANANKTVLDPAVDAADRFINQFGGHAPTNDWQTNIPSDVIQDLQQFLETLQQSATPQQPASPQQDVAPQQDAPPADDPAPPDQGN